ncbi:MAG: hypothetical protein IPO63_16565 [Bacteroidetes bacterium]|nr:hypothetical protein [Bacteroidota bacterium]
MLWNTNSEFDDDFLNDDTASGEALNEIKREHERISNLPVMIKAHQIFDVVNAIVETFSNTDDISSHYKEVMFSNVRKLRNGIVAAEDANYFSAKMENAVLVKVAVQNLLAQEAGLSLLNLADPSYLEVLRNEIEEFQPLFMTWISLFDRSCDMDDGWNLFKNVEVKK